MTVVDIVVVEDAVEVVSIAGGSAEVAVEVGVQNAAAAGLGVCDVVESVAGVL